MLRNARTVAWLALCSGLAACAGPEAPSTAPPPPDPSPGGGHRELGALSPEDRQAIDARLRQVLAQQVDAWNRGDLEAFMEGYWRSPEMRFVSGGAVRQGWEETLERYRATYPDRAAMGTLSFEEVEVEVLSSEAALVWGAYVLERAADQPRGRFSLLFRLVSDDQGAGRGGARGSAWRIVHDHTSAAE